MKKNDILRKLDQTRAARALMTGVVVRVFLVNAFLIKCNIVGVSMGFQFIIIFAQNCAHYKIEHTWQERQIVLARSADTRAINFSVEMNSSLIFFRSIVL